MIDCSPMKRIYMWGHCLHADQRSHVLWIWFIQQSSHMHCYSGLFVHYPELSVRGHEFMCVHVKVCCSEVMWRLHTSVNMVVLYFKMMSLDGIYVAFTTTLNCQKKQVLMKLSNVSCVRFRCVCSSSKKDKLPLWILQPLSHFILPTGLTSHL